jgi:hypothetical protein
VSFVVLIVFISFDFSYMGRTFMIEANNFNESHKDMNVGENNTD